MSPETQALWDAYKDPYTPEHLRPKLYELYVRSANADQTWEKAGAKARAEELLRVLGDTNG
jgi:hypothetical protein